MLRGPVARLFFALAPTLMGAGGARAQETAPPDPAAPTATAPPPDAATATPAPEAPAPPAVPAARLVYSPGALAPVCPSADEVKASIAARLGVDPFAEPAERVLLIAVEGTERPDGTPVAQRARIELFDAALAPLGVRVLQSDDGCAELMQAAALAASIALAPERALLPPPVVPPPEAAPPEVPPPEAPPPEVPPPEPKATPARWPFLPEEAVVLAGLGSSWSFFLGPGPSLGPAVSAAARDGLWELRAELRGRAGFEADIATVHGALAATVLPCLHVPLVEVLGDDPVGVQACATGTAGAVWAAGGWFGASPYVGAGGQLGVEWVQPSRAALRLWTQVEVALFRPIYVDLTGGALLDRAAPANAAIGVTWEIPISP